MMTAERSLDLYRKLESTLSATGSIPEACDAVAHVVLSSSHVVEACVVTRDAIETMLAPGERGRQDLSEELRAAGRLAKDPGEGWTETMAFDTLVRPLTLAGSTRVIVLARRPGGVDADDRLVVDAIIERGRSLMAHIVDRAALVDRNLELATIYDIDRIRDAQLPFPEMLQRILARVLEIVPADGAAIALLEGTSATANAPDFILHVRGQKSTATGDQFFHEATTAIEALMEDAFARRVTVEGLVGERSPREFLCTPLILDDQFLGAFLLASRPGRRFTGRDRRLFRAVSSQTDTAVFEDRQRRRLRTVFQRTVSRDVFDALMKSSADPMTGRRAEITVFFSDLRGFTSVSEHLPVEDVVGMLNTHLARMTEVVLAHGGTIDKFIGDAVMAIFGAPLPRADHAVAAVRCAVAMRSAHNELLDAWANRGWPTPKIGVGMNSGSAFVGPVGGEQLVSYTAVGDNVNLAARLEGISGPDEIIISRRVRDLCGDDVTVEPRGTVIVKGKTTPIEIFSVIACE